MFTSIRSLRAAGLILILILVALAWPGKMLAEANISNGWLLGLQLLCLAGLAAVVLGLSLSRHGASVPKAMAQLDKHALDVTVNNASMMSSFTRVVSFSRQQADTLASMRQHVDELGSSVHTVAQSAQLTRDDVDSMNKLAVQGAELLHETTGRIASLDQSAKELDQRFGEVMRQTGEIESFLRMIQDVAMQTNLLSLNAAVEAARAGEQGRGFAVVADEINKLAARSNDATVQIREMITGITSSAQAADGSLKTVLVDVQVGVDRIGETSQALAGIGEKSTRTLAAASDLASAAQTQSRLAEQIVNDVDALSLAANQSVEWVGKSNEQLRVVQRLIGQLKHEISDLQPQRREIDLFMDCIEEMRACNILIMNAQAFSELGDVIKRIAELDLLIDTGWKRFRQHQGRRLDDALLMQFETAIKAYRAIRNDVLRLAKQERFDEVRTKVPSDVRPAYDGAKEALVRIDAQDRQMQARRLGKRDSGEALVNV